MASVFYFYAKIKNSVNWKNRIFILPILWIAFEYLHLNWDLSWPWLTLGNVFSAHPSWIQWYSYTGVLGGTLWVLMVNILVFKFYENKFSFKISKTYIICIIVSFLIPLLWSNYLYNQYKDIDNLVCKTSSKNPVFDSINVLIVQPNIDPYSDKFSLSQTDQMNNVSLLINSCVVKFRLGQFVTKRK